MNMSIVRELVILAVVAGGNVTQDDICELEIVARGKILQVRQFALPGLLAMEESPEKRAALFWLEKWNKDSYARTNRYLARRVKSIEELSAVLGVANGAKP